MDTKRTEGVRRHFTYANVMSTLSVFLVIAGGTAMAAKIKADSVKSKSIKNGQVKLADLGSNSVDSSKVVDNSLGGADINESQLTLPASPGSLPPSGPAGGSLTGEYPNPTLGANAVDTAQVAANSLVADDLAPGSVGSSEVAANSLIDADLGANSVKGAEFEVSGTFADSFGAFGANACSQRTFDPPGLGGNSLADNMILVTPDTAWGGTFDDFQVTAEAEDADTIRLVVCNNGPNSDDPDSGTTTFRYVAIDLS